MDELIDLEPDADDPAVGSDRGVSPLPRAERVRHAPDRSILAVREGALVARCSCWWRARTSYDDAEPRTGIIGHYAAVDRPAGEAVLRRACDVLESAGCAIAAGPMDGTTWRRYRFIIERGDEPPFFLEPDHPGDWPEHWSGAGFSPLATYTSAVTHQLDVDHVHTSGTLERLSSAGISIREFDVAQPDAELRRIYQLAKVSFTRNLLYSPIVEDEFLEDSRALLPVLRPELVLIAERDGVPAGFLFAVPDMLSSRDTVIIKTAAVDPRESGRGVAGALVALVHRRARQLGYRRAIHALMHETNVSRRVSDRYARTFRRYALLSKVLGLSGVVSGLSRTPHGPAEASAEARLKPDTTQVRLTLLC
jgi:GNAT superfamily N-acetyltransferase